MDTLRRGPSSASYTGVKASHALRIIGGRQCAAGWSTDRASSGELAHLVVVGVPSDMAAWKIVGFVVTLAMPMPSMVPLRGCRMSVAHARGRRARWTPGVGGLKSFRSVVVMVLTYRVG